MASSATTLTGKPLLRGVSHQLAAFVAVGAWIALVRTAPTTHAAVAATIYGGTLTTLFTVSALYHRPTWSPRARAVMRRFDHSAVFLLIAGTYTPLCLLMGGRRGIILLAAVWGGAGLGMLRAMFWPYAPKALIAALSVALGWAVVAVLPELRATIGTGGLVLLGAGGLAYSVGAVIYAMGKPNPVPGVFGYHEVFHALVIVAAACHYTVIAGSLGAIR